MRLVPASGLVFRSVSFSPLLVENSFLPVRAMEQPTPTLAIRLAVLAGLNKPMCCERLTNFASTEIRKGFASKRGCLFASPSSVPPTVASSSIPCKDTNNRSQHRKTSTLNFHPVPREYFGNALSSAVAATPNFYSGIGLRSMLYTSRRRKAASRMLMMRVHSRHASHQVTTEPHCLPPLPSQRKHTSFKIPNFPNSPSREVVTPRTRSSICVSNYVRFLTTSPFMLPGKRHNLKRNLEKHLSTRNPLHPLRPSTTSPSLLFTNFPRSQVRSVPCLLPRALCSGAPGLFV